MTDIRLTLQPSGWLVQGAMIGAWLGGSAAILCVLWPIDNQKFQIAVDFIAIAIFFATGMVAWHVRDWDGHNILYFVGIGGLFVALLDIAHIFGNLGVIPPTGGKGILAQFRLASLVLESGVFLVAAGKPTRHFRSPVLLAALTAATIGLLLLVCSGILNPVLSTNLTRAVGLRVNFPLAAVFVFVLVRLWRARDGLELGVHRLLLWSVGIRALAEFIFCLDDGTGSLFELIGHLGRIVAGCLLMLTVIESGFRCAQPVVARALKQPRDSPEMEGAEVVQILSGLLEAVPRPVLLLDQHGRLRFLGKAGEAFFDRDPREMIGRHWRQAGLPEEVMGPLAALAAIVCGNGEALISELTVSWQGKRCLEAEVSPVMVLPGLSPLALVCLRDVSRLKRAEDNLKASQENNRVLIQEVHHRVKNNLQIVSSMLHMQGWNVTDPDLRKYFEEACGRILSLAKVHELLYRQQNMASLDFSQYVRALSTEMLRLNDLREDRVVLTVMADALPLPVARAEPLALIVYELVSHTMTHAFGDRGGELRVGLEAREMGTGLLVIADNGQNALRPLDFGSAGSEMGLRMVGALAKQLHATLEVHRGAGVIIEVRFPVDDAPLW